MSASPTPPTPPTPPSIEHDDTTRRPIPIDVRRAVLSVFFRAGGGPLTIDEIVRRTREEAGLDLSQLPGVSPRQRVSDILRHQVRAGRAEAPRRGTYRLLTHEFSDSTRWRCLHWREAAARRERYPKWISLSRESTPSRQAAAGSLPR
ncbi:MAG: hypothetical protein WCC60_07795 [Ilumatobacteraceae bacterium]